MSSNRDPEIFLSASEMEWIKTAQENGISYRAVEDARKFVKDWDDFLRVLDEKSLMLYVSASHMILSTSVILDADDAGVA